VKFIEELMAIKTDKLGPETLLAAAKTSMGSKIVGAEGDFFGQMVVDAIQAVQTTDQVRLLFVYASDDAALLSHICSHTHMKARCCTLVTSFSAPSSQPF
jgi:hypothetical protein